MVSASRATLPDDQHDEDLEDRRDGQDDEGPLDRPDTTLGRGDRGVDHPVGVGMAAVVAVAMAVAVPMMAAWPFSPKPSQSSASRNIAMPGPFRSAATGSG